MGFNGILMGFNWFEMGFNGILMGPKNRVFSHIKGWSSIH